MKINVKELNRIVDATYEYGTLDCYQLLRIAYGDIFPTEYGEVTSENYTEIFEDHEDAAEFLVSAIEDLFEEVSYPFFGCICIVYPIKLVGLYAGNNNMITAFYDKGIKVIPLNAIKGNIKFFKVTIDG